MHGMAITDVFEHDRLWAKGIRRAEGHSLDEWPVQDPGEVPRRKHTHVEEGKSSFLGLGSTGVLCPKGSHLQGGTSRALQK